MEAGYWLQRWNEGRIGWHRREVMPLLEKHWPALDAPRGTRVLVPLCGKSLDMLWLARQGMQVVGVEISPIPVESSLAENQLRARIRAAHGMTQYVVTNAPEGGGIEIVNGDMFGVDVQIIAACDAFYDRAAAIALSAPMRERLANDVYAKLPAGSRGLLITLDYPQDQMQGPPFSIGESEVQGLFAAGWNIEQLERLDILASQPSFSEQGVTGLHTAVYRMTRRDA